MGSTVHVEMEVVAAEQKGADRGVITFSTRVLNQNDRLPG